MKQTRRREQRFTGHPVSPGIGIGPVHEATEPDLVVSTKKLTAAEVAPELARLEEAVARSRHQLQKLKNRLAALPEDSQAEIAPMMDVYLHMLGPSRLLRGIKARMQEDLLCPEAAVHAEAEAQAEATLAQPGADRAGRNRRAEEVRELGRRMLRNLTRQPFRSFTALAQGSVLAAQDLRPADAALIQPSRFAGIITAEGGAEGHMRSCFAPWACQPYWARLVCSTPPPPAAWLLSMAIPARLSSTPARPAWRRRGRNFRR
ncbi:MAG: phosphoenolpyruvate-utilizing N-terminal domain-containing protein [Acidocella sp.]